MADLLGIIDAWDKAAIAWMQETLRQPWLTVVMEVITSRDFWILPLLLLCLFLFYRGGRLRVAAVLLLPLVLLSDVFTVRILKPLVGRPRPLGHSGLSFPSAHAANAFAIASLLGFFIRKAWFWILAVFLACAVAFSRIYLGKHYPTDVVAGALFGVACAAIVITAYYAWKK